MIRRLLRPLLLPVLRRDPGEVDRQARSFSLAGSESRELVTGVGRAFLSGFNVMLEAGSLEDTRATGLAVEPHFRPFFFEGAAMGYLPRAYVTSGVSWSRAEADLLAMDPRFRYLYNVGLGFWFGFRHPRRPAALESLAPHLDPFYVPLCYDGFGFKVGFFDFPGRPEAAEILDRAPAGRRAYSYQGFGRALFFSCMDDPARFASAKAAAPAEYRDDMEAGRALAVAFTGVNRPERIIAHLASARDENELGLRLLGVTWALTAREMNDPDYFAQCLAGLPPAQQTLLRELPRLCRDQLAQSADYDQWRAGTSRAVLAAYSASEEVLGR